MNNPIAVIVKVSESNYIPSQCKTRAIISANMFTANIEKEDLETVRSDPKVHSVSEATKIPLMTPIDIGAPPTKPDATPGVYDFSKLKLTEIKK